ncbi:MAG: hypothetical protein AAJB65_00105 [Candidatus Hodgkinia cicadicola]
MSNICNTINEISKRELIRRLLENELVKGTVAHKNETFMMVNVDYKQNVKMYAENVWNYEAYEPSTNMLVYIEQIEYEVNKTKLSRGSIDTEEAWTVLTNTNSENQTVKGLIQTRMSEGYIVKVLGLTALLPHSLVDKSLQLQNLVGHVASLKIFELNKSRNLIKLRLTKTEEETEAAESFQFGDSAWGIIKECLEDSYIIDLCSQDGNLILYTTSQIYISKLIFEIEIGQVIELINVTTSDEEVELVLKDDTAEGDEQQLLVFGIIIKISQHEVIVQVAKDEFATINIRYFNTENMIYYLNENEIFTEDLVKINAVKNIKTNEQAMIDFDTDVTRYYKYVFQDEQFTVNGEAIELFENAILVDLGNDICGIIETDTSEQAEKAYESLVNKIVKFVIIDYDPEQNIIYLEVAANEQTTALLVEA